MRSTDSSAVRVPSRLDRGASLPEFQHGLPGLPEIRIRKRKIVFELSTLSSRTSTYIVQAVSGSSQTSKGA